MQITVNTQPGWAGARNVVVTTLSDETRLRNLAWIEENRRLVDQASGGKIGYIYVPSTGLDGQAELVRMFYAQWNKEGLIIDERFNNGGQIPDRFIELLNRKPLAFWAVRDGKTGSGRRWAISAQRPCSSTAGAARAADQRRPRAHRRRRCDSAHVPHVQPRWQLVQGRLRRRSRHRGARRPYCPGSGEGPATGARN